MWVRREREDLSGRIPLESDVRLWGDRQRTLNRSLVHRPGKLHLERRVEREVALRASAHGLRRKRGEGRRRASGDLLGRQAQQQPAHQKNNRRGNQNELSEPLLQEATARRALHQ